MTAQRQRATDDVGRRALALWAALLWLLGFELLPDLHLGMHGQLAAHSHGAHAHEHDDHHDDAHDHHHDHDVDAHEHEHAEPPDSHEFVPVASAGLEHGRHDLLHRGIAVMQPPIAMPTIAQARVVSIARVRVAAPQLRSRAPLQTRARGPPLAAAL